MRRFSFLSTIWFHCPAWAARIHAASSFCGCLKSSVPCKILFQRLSSEGHTRSHPEHGSQASDRRWYLAPGPGRVGRRWILEAPCQDGRGPLRFYRHPGPRAGATLRGSLPRHPERSEGSSDGTDCAVMPDPDPASPYTVPACVPSRLIAHRFLYIPYK